MIYGATGSVGTAAIEIAKHYGASVTAVCSYRGAELTKNLGADVVVEYTKEDFRALKAQFDIIFDAVGKIKKKDCQKLLKPNGKFITVGGMDVAKETGAQLEVLSSLFDEGKLHANIEKVYALEDAAQAHSHVDSGRKKGNVVIRLED